MQKLPASQIIYADDTFVRDMYDKFKEIDQYENQGNQELTAKEAGEYCNKSAQTIRNHIKNFVREHEGVKKIKPSRLDGKLGYLILQKDLDQYKINPYTTL